MMTRPLKVESGKVDAPKADPRNERERKNAKSTIGARE